MSRLGSRETRPALRAEPLSVWPGGLAACSSSGSGHVGGSDASIPIGRTVRSPAPLRHRAIAFDDGPADITALPRLEPQPPWPRRGSEPPTHSNGVDQARRPFVAFMMDGAAADPRRRRQGCRDDRIRCADVACSAWRPSSSDSSICLLKATTSPEGQNRRTRRFGPIGAS